MAKAKNLERWGLKEEIRLLLLDWCAANYGATATEIVEEALQEHIQRRRNEPEMEKRFKAARDRRLGGSKPKVVKLANDETA
ncbi:MAG TPA: hypothetical protein VJ798_10775 [Rhizomicrobium sp.]|nr:hypothetical protein [Rhizomicrobium sp.]